MILQLHCRTSRQSRKSGWKKEGELRGEDETKEHWSEIQKNCVDNHRCGVEIGGSACLSPLLGIGLTFFKRCITMMGGPFFFLRNV